MIKSKRREERMTLLTGLILFCLPVSLGFVQDRNAAGTLLRWPSMPIDYSINSRGSLDIYDENGDGTENDERLAIQAAFSTWDAIEDTTISFGSPGSSDKSGFQDGETSVLWIEDPTDSRNLPDVPAKTSVYATPDGTIEEADIILNGVHFSWTTTRANGTYTTVRGPMDVQAVVTHEVGHLLGLLHVTQRSSALFPWIYGGSVRQRELSQDEVSGALALYPAASAPDPATISGTVARAGGQGVPGAYVVVFQNGQPVVGEIADGDGHYTIRHVPPGDCVLRVQPYSRAINGDNSYFSDPANVDVDFSSLFWGDTASEENSSIITLAAGQDRTGIDFTVSGSAIEPDQFESDDTYSEAKPILTDGRAQIHHTSTAGDEDWASFSATAGKVYVIETRHLGLKALADLSSHNSDTLLELYGETGARLDDGLDSAGEHDDKNSVEQDYSSRIVWAETTSAVRKIRSYQHLADTSGAGVYFDLLVTELGPLTAPVVTSVEPAIATTDGAIFVTVHGSSFGPGAQVRFGGADGLHENVQECETPTDCRAIKVYVPAASAAGKATITADNVDGSSGELVDGFEYEPIRSGTFSDASWDAFGGYLGGALSVCWGDYDGDGDQDLFRGTTYATADLGLWRNEGNGTYTDVTADEGIDTASCEIRSCSWADYDGDTDLDLYLVCGGTGASNRLFENRGELGFSEVAATAGLQGSSGVGKMDAAWADYDLDGDLDLYLVYSEPDDPPYQANQLYCSDGADPPLFSDVAGPAGVAITTKGRRVLWGDYDGDGYDDLYLVNVSGRADLLYHNNADGTFTDVTVPAGIVEDEHCYDAAWADLDGDGLLDLICVGYPALTGKPQRLWINGGDGTFVDRASEAGIADLDGDARTVTILDRDNDGDLDLFVGHAYGSHDQLLDNDGSSPPLFTDLTSSAGIDESAYPGNATAAACADDDGDGDVEIYTAATGTEEDYFWSNTSNKNSALTIRLKGTLSNRGGLGAVVTVLPDIDLLPSEEPEDAKQRCIAALPDAEQQRQELLGGSLGQSSMELELGTPPRAVNRRQADCLVVDWPRSGLRSVFTQVAWDQILEIEETSETLEVTRVEPSTGSTAGGESVTLLGFQFFQDAEVFFGGVPATGVSVDDLNHITCTTPANPQGPADVTVRNQGGDEDTLEGGFFYLDPSGCLIDDLTLTKDAGRDAVLLEWGDVGLERYDVKRALGPKPADFDAGFRTSVPRTEYVDQGVLGDGSNYFYLIRSACPGP